MHEWKYVALLLFVVSCYVALLLPINAQEIYQDISAAYITGQVTTLRDSADFKTISSTSSPLLKISSQHLTKVDLDSVRSKSPMSDKT